MTGVIPSPLTPAVPVPIPERGEVSVAAVLWDIDGTLLTAGRGALDAFLDAVRDVAGVRPVGSGLDLGGRMDPDIAAALLRSVDADEHLAADVLDRLRKLGAARAADIAGQVRAFDGVRQAVDWLAACAVPQTVLTGNIESIARIKLAGTDLVPPIDPDLGGFGDSGGSRADAGALALRRLAASGRPTARDRCWIVGDTPRDAACAKELGVRCALVATGRHSAASLAEHGADIVVETLSGASELFRWWTTGEATAPPAD